jgi:hypothetical protein
MLVDHHLLPVGAGPDADPDPGLSGIDRCLDRGVVPTTGRLARGADVIETVRSPL